MYILPARPECTWPGRRNFAKDSEAEIGNKANIKATSTFKSSYYNERTAIQHEDVKDTRALISGRAPLHPRPPAVLREKKEKEIPPRSTSSMSFPPNHRDSLPLPE